MERMQGIMLLIEVLLVSVALLLRLLGRVVFVLLVLLPLERGAGKELLGFLRRRHLLLLLGQMWMVLFLLVG